MSTRPRASVGSLLVAVLGATIFIALIGTLGMAAAWCALAIYLGSVGWTVLRSERGAEEAP